MIEAALRLTTDDAYDHKSDAATTRQWLFAEILTREDLETNAQQSAWKLEQVEVEKEEVVRELTMSEAELKECKEQESGALRNQIRDMLTHQAGLEATKRRRRLTTAKGDQRGGGHLRRYAATLSSIFDEYTLSNDYYKEMVALDESITSVLTDAEKTLPELKELKAQPEKHPTVKITLKEREGLFNAITEERKKRYEESQKSRGYK
ncbi:hypothetical protein QFC20_006246 [Naganishia adeliensis]|uniref:Uncharacterized protein n=1 Tax=Naganishia adeliensis TaxID=92952 RepID=A0ACC2VDY0_9TREE|nr:hypothetical protein QFC20_006246 [Naganishia adeliensis]